MHACRNTNNEVRTKMIKQNTQLLLKRRHFNRTAHRRQVAFYYIATTKKSIFQVKN